MLLNSFRRAEMGIGWPKRGAKNGGGHGLPGWQQHCFLLWRLVLLWQKRTRAGIGPRDRQTWSIGLP